MLTVQALRKSQTLTGHYILTGSDEFLQLLPYLYGKLEGTWEITVIADGIKDIRAITAATIPKCVNVLLLADIADLEQYQLEKPDLKVEKVSPYDAYLALFTDIDGIVFDPKAVSEIYKRAGPSIDKLKEGLAACIEVSDGVKVTIKDVDKVLLPNKRVYASDVVKAFLKERNVPYRWSLVDKLVTDLGQSFAYYSIRKYIYNLLVNKDKYLQNETVAERFERDIEHIDALTIAHAYITFTTYDKPELLYAALYILERRNYDVSFQKQ